MNAVFLRGILLSLVLLFLKDQTCAKNANRTIDDAFEGDSQARLTYSPSGYWSNGDDCDTCLVHPNKSKAYDGTWHDYSAFPTDTDYESAYMNASFEGSAVYIYCILANNATGAGTTANYSFVVDGESSPIVFFHSADNTSEYYYNVLVYSNDTLGTGRHNVQLLPNIGKVDTLVLFDYFTFTSTSASSSSGLSTGAKVGVAVGSIVGVLTIAGLVFIVWLIKRRQNDAIVDPQFDEVVPFPTAHAEGPNERFLSAIEKQSQFSTGTIVPSLSFFRNGSNAEGGGSPVSASNTIVTTTAGSHTDHTRNEHAYQASAVSLTNGRSAESVGPRTAGSTMGHPETRAALRTQIAVILQEMELEERRRLEAFQLPVFNTPPPDYDAPARSSSATTRGPCGWPLDILSNDFIILIGIVAVPVLWLPSAGWWGSARRNVHAINIPLHTLCSRRRCRHHFARASFAKDFVSQTVFWMIGSKWHEQHAAVTRRVVLESCSSSSTHKFYDGESTRDWWTAVQWFYDDHVSVSVITGNMHKLLTWRPQQSLSSKIFLG
ncbi:hypothetical protein FISHEDRAFT_62914 [Fistulina hepatica ATCC 64428]|uniref:Uncharacterized protein n=1 Tax=Fistulina hepatica ATCC 64428 TaxID=1128425 RepID=A0A0D7A161_9AGAR|nr:hypothetical protein FISHEDRAFT_62914 [Fistulina hepatica ATCC 64428]